MSNRDVNVFRLMWRLLLYRPWLYAMDAAFLVALQLTPLLPGLAAREFFNALTGGQKAGWGLVSVAALFVGAALTRIAVAICAIVADVLQSFFTTSLLRHNMLERILELPGARALREAPGETIARFRDDPEQVWVMVTLLPDSVGAILSIATAYVVLARIDRTITLTVFVPIVLVYFLAQGVSGRIEILRRKSREAAAKLTGAIGEAFGAVQAIQVSLAEAPVTAYIDRLGHGRRAARRQEELFNAVLGAVESGTGPVGTGLTLLLAAAAMRSGKFTVGDLSIFASWLVATANYSTFAGYYVSLYRSTKVSLERMLAVLGGSPHERLVRPAPLHFNVRKPVVGSLGHGRPAHRVDPLERISALGLTCLHPGTDRGIHNVHLEIEGGSFTVVTGKVGSGKSTLLKAVLGLLPLNDGELLWNERKVEDPSAFMVPPRCAYTGQVPFLFSDTVKENILLGTDESAVNLDSAVKSAVLEDDLARMDNGLETLIGPKGMKLSGGQIQRVAAARMFARDADLLVCDDLSSALDVQTERTLWERLSQARAARPVTCLVVSTRPAVLQRADNILVLSEGRVVDQGRLDDLLGRCQEMRDIWEAGVGRT